MSQISNLALPTKIETKITEIETKVTDDRTNPINALSTHIPLLSQ